MHIRTYEGTLYAVFSSIQGCGPRNWQLSLENFEEVRRASELLFQKVKIAQKEDHQLAVSCHLQQSI